MCRGIGLLAGMLAAAALALPSAASADTTLGLTTQPAGSTAMNCAATPAPVLLGQATSDPSTPYAVPAGGGAVSGWSINTAGDTPGDTVTMWVLAPIATSYTVIGSDTETLPSPLPADNIASFTLGTPITAVAGDTFGLTATGTNVICYWDTGTTPAGDTLFLAPPPTTATPGQTLTPSGNSLGGFTLNLGVTLAATVDAGISAAAGPANATAGYPALLTDTVANGGPGTGPITVTDAVPAGLQIDAAVAAGESCTIAGQRVPCTVAGLASGASAPVDLVVTPGAAGSYVNSASVALGSATDTDPNAANDTASATLTVSAPPTAGQPPVAKCVVTSIKGTPQSVAKRVLTALGCRVGKIKHATSNKIAKGNVVKTAPGAGTYAAKKAIALTVSSGKLKHKHHKPGKKHKKK